MPTDEPPTVDETLLEGLHPGLSDVDLATELVTRAGSLAASMRADGLSAQRKTSVSDIVTAADLAAERFVVAALGRCRADDGILGEEGASRASTSGRTWVVDPVDGTYNFHSGLAYWCSAIALRGPGVGGRPTTLLGAVHQPTSAETVVGGVGHPSTHNGAPVPPLEPRGLSEGSLATYIHPTTLGDPDVLEVWLALVAQVATPRVLGSGSLDLCGVATGRIGAWAQHSTADWDWYPGQAVVEAAGGLTDVVEHRGHRWHLAGNDQAVDELLRVLRRV